MEMIKRILIYFSTCMLFAAFAGDIVDLWVCLLFFAWMGKVCFMRGQSLNIS